MVCFRRLSQPFLENSILILLATSTARSSQYRSFRHRLCSFLILCLPHIRTALRLSPHLASLDSSILFRISLASPFRFRLSQYSASSNIQQYLSNLRFRSDTSIPSTASIESLLLILRYFDCALLLRLSRFLDYSVLLSLCAI